MVNQQWQAKHHEQACFGISYLWYLSRSDILLHTVVQAWLYLPLVVLFSVSWAAIILLSVLIPKALRSFRRYPIFCFYLPAPRNAAFLSPTRSPNTTHFGSFVFSIRATNPADHDPCLTQCHIGILHSLEYIDHASTLRTGQYSN